MVVESSLRIVRVGAADKMERLGRGAESGPDVEQL